MTDKATPPSLNQLLDWLDGQLPPREAEAVANAVEVAIQSGDHALRRQLMWLRAFLTASQRVPLRSTSPEIMDRLKQLFIEGKASTELPIRHHIATLANTQNAGAGAGIERIGAGLRAAVRIDPKRDQQMIFTAEVADVIINVSTQTHAIAIRGQVFPNRNFGPADLTVQLLREQGSAGLTGTTAQGYFTFMNLAPDTYRIVVSADEYEIETSPIIIAL